MHGAHGGDAWRHTGTTCHTLPYGVVVSVPVPPLERLTDTTLSIDSVVEVVPVVPWHLSARPYGV